MRLTRGNAATALGVAAIVVVAGAGASAAIGPGHDGQTVVTAHFTRAVGLYKGSQVRMLGVKVGKIDTIKAQGTTVAVKMTVDDGIKVPATATASIVPPSLVSDRYVQLSVYKSGAVLANNGDIPVAHTQIPVEKDDILADLNKLDVGLGPTGANANGSLSDLITTGAKNLTGNGAQINQTLRDVSQLVGTLDDNKSDLVGTVDQLDKFTNFLLANDSNIKTLYTDLASVSSQLSDDRGALAAAFKNLAIATKQLDVLATTNRTNLKGSVDKIVDITNLLVQDKSSLEEILDDTPLALSNLAGSFDPNTQTLDTRANTPLSDQDGLANLLCNALQNGVLPAAAANAACGATGTALGTAGSAAKPVVSAVPGPVKSAVDSAGLPTQALPLNRTNK